MPTYSANRYAEMKEVRKQSGRPPKFTDPEELQEKINQYFKDCEGHVLTDADGNPVVTKYGEPVIVGARPLTVTGLALAIGFQSRTSLLEYEGKPKFREIIVRAKSRIEQYTEERLFDKDGANGAKFSLQNNFKAWNDAAKEMAKESAPMVNIINDIPRPAESVELDVNNGGTDGE